MDKVERIIMIEMREKDKKTKKVDLERSCF